MALVAAAGVCECRSEAHASARADAVMRRIPVRSSPQTESLAIAAHRQCIYALDGRAHLLSPFHRYDMHVRRAVLHRTMALLVGELLLA
jgi:hypothetical protein